MAKRSRRETTAKQRRRCLDPAPPLSRVLLDTESQRVQILLTMSASSGPRRALPTKTRALMPGNMPKQTHVDLFWRSVWKWS